MFPLELNPIARRRRPTKKPEQNARRILAADRLEIRNLLATYTVDFGDLSLEPESHWDGPDAAGTGSPVVVGSFRSGGVDFKNSYDESFGGFWKSDFAYSNEVDTATAGFGNRYSSFAGGGNGDENFGLSFGYKDAGFDPSDPNELAQLPTLTLPAGAEIQSAFITNTTYAALSMRDGDDFAKRFGGTSGDDPDWFKITAYGTDANGNVVPGAPEFYLADFRAADHAQDYIVDTWTQFDLSALAGARKVHFNVSSTDVHPDFGLNTPAFFAIDDLVYTIANTAPSLNIAPDTQLDAIAEDQTDAPGMLVADLIASAVTDPDADALQGIAVVGVSNTGGTWQYSLDNGATWADVGTPEETEARLLSSDSVTRVRVLPHSNFSGELTINYRAWDQIEGVPGGLLSTAGRAGGSGTFSAEVETAVQVISAVNDAPVLDNKLTPSLGSILEDAKNPSGTLIKYLANPAITDIDESAVKGLAVVSAYGANGDWQFSLDGVAWQSMSGATESAARLLPVDETTRVRFLPKADYNGDAWISYRAWDRIEGTTGETLSTGGRLGLTKTFSLATEAVKITVKAVNDAPVVSLSGTVGYVRNRPAIVLAPFGRVTDVDSPNFDGGRLRVRIASGTSSFNLLAIGAGFMVDETFQVRQGTTVIGTLNPGGGDGTTDLVVTFNASATKALVQQLVRSITFRTLGGLAGTRVVKFSVSDGDGGLSAEATKTVNVT